MRNAAAANYDDDFAPAAPSRKKPTKRAASTKVGPGKGRKKSKRRFGFALDMHRVARWGAIGMSVTVALGIMVNALMMQKGHHPAPLFGKSIALGETSRPVVVASAPAKAPVAAPVPAAEPTPAPEPPAPLARDAASAPDGDAIGRLLQGGGVPAGDRPEAKTVSGAQRALTKLGFAVKSTGTLGPQTKKAIEAFEKDRHLPVHGELSRRVLKILAAESGLRIER